MAGRAVTAQISAGRNVQALATALITNASGEVTYSLVDVGTVGTTDTITFTNGSVTGSATLTYGTTTGPLGQGVANGVGMAMAARYEKGLLDPNNKTDLFDHNIWVICSDGDLQEGVSAEASSLAGTQQLGNLKVIYDDNRISIEGDTHVAFAEDVSARYRAYGWDVIEVEAKKDGDVDRDKLESAMIKALEQKTKPVLIRLHTVIAWPAPNAKGTAKSHGSALGADEVAATKLALGLDPEKTFIAPDEVIAHTRNIKVRANNLYSKWLIEFNKWQKENPEQSALLSR